MFTPPIPKPTSPRFLLNYRFWLHVTGWLAFFASPLILPLPIFKQLPQYYVNYLFITRTFVNLILIGVFYLNLHYLTPQLLSTKNTLRFFLCLPLLFLMVLLLDYLLLQAVRADLRMYLSKTEGNDPFLQEVLAGDFLAPQQLLANLVLFALIFLSSSLWAVLTDRLDQQQFNQQILYEKTSAELAVLRLQISPHFLFNTLNNIRWLARIKSDQAETSVMELSEILRYMLYHVVHHQVALLDEVKNLKRYVNLQKLRLHPKAEVQLICVDFDQDIKIEPLLFMPFVENAFKFGVHSEEPSKVAINLSVKDRELIFTCTNQCFDFADDELIKGTGQGLLNVQRRLELYYPQTHTLIIRNDQKLFSVLLRLNLKHG
ncbi:Histidine kinase [Dyadobacter koreensis]|uniref:Histidine kinase n=1 Tax=Dyadobacter koreensis TaxID=408657 RepID=A0A1H6XB91_9BACT|nr:sensor histidine kinase [Dyadobacter koreensis]SEJ26419.1 Histidine kinase [Dyadobacter koreensis]